MSPRGRRRRPAGRGNLDFGDITFGDKTSTPPPTAAWSSTATTTATSLTDGSVKQVGDDNTRQHRRHRRRRRARNVRSCGNGQRRRGQLARETGGGDVIHGQRGAGRQDRRHRHQRWRCGRRQRWPWRRHPHRWWGRRRRCDRWVRRRGGHRSDADTTHHQPPAATSPTSKPMVATSPAASMQATTTTRRTATTPTTRRTTADDRRSTTRFTTTDRHPPGCGRRPVLTDRYNAIAQLAGTDLDPRQLARLPLSERRQHKRDTMTQPNDPRKVKVIVELIDHTEQDRRGSTTAAIWPSGWPRPRSGSATRRSAW